MLIFKESWARDLNAVRKYMADYIGDPDRHEDDICFDNKEVMFLDETYLESDVIFIL